MLFPHENGVFVWERCSMVDIRYSVLDTRYSRVESREWRVENRQGREGLGDGWMNEHRQVPGVRKHQSRRSYHSTFVLILQGGMRINVSPIERDRAARLLDEGHKCPTFFITTPAFDDKPLHDIFPFETVAITQGRAAAGNVRLARPFEDALHFLHG